MSNDHYIADHNNAHIDTRDFEALLSDLAQGATGEALDRANLSPRIHELVMQRLRGPIDQPPADIIICRYFSTTKFLWFLRNFEVYFGRACEFEDKKDCAIPADYNDCVEHFLYHRKVAPVAWAHYAEQCRSEWLVSCWTELTDHYDDHLLWHCYAGGSFGVGVTIQYGQLQQLLARESTPQGMTDFTSGRVTYGQPLRLPPFHKRRPFRNEKEIRFVGRGELLAAANISIASLVEDHVGLRFSPDAPKHHIHAVMEAWIKAGGDPDRYEIAGE